MWPGNYFCPVSATIHPHQHPGPCARRPLQPPKVLVGHVTLKSISLPHRPQTHPVPLCPLSLVEPSVMILSQHQIQTLLGAYHLQINTGVQEVKSSGRKVLFRTCHGPRLWWLVITTHPLLEHTQEIHTDWSLTGDTANGIMSHHAFLHTRVHVEVNLLVVYEDNQQQQKWREIRCIFHTHNENILLIFYQAICKYERYIEKHL